MKRIHLHDLPVRIWHWVNLAAFIILIVTGAQIRMGDKLNLFSFETAVNVHSWLGFILIANFFLWLVYYIVTGNIKIYIPPLHKPLEFAKKALIQAKFYGWGIMVGDDNPHHATFYNKFNPMQQVSYLAIMVLLIPLQFVTGLFLWDPHLFSFGVNLYRRNPDCGSHPCRTLDLLQRLHDRAFLSRHARPHPHGTYHRNVQGI